MGALASRKGPVTTAGCSHRRIMVDGLGRIDGWWNDLPPRVMSVRFSFPESWSSTPLAKKAVPGTAQDIFVLDNAFVLIEGQPTGRVAQAFRLACASNELGAPSFAFCAKGGHHARLQ